MNAVPPSLTEEQRRIWVLIAAGYSRAEIRKMSVPRRSLRGLYNQISSLYQKIGARGVVDATRMAIQSGVVAFPETTRIPSRTYYTPFLQFLISGCARSGCEQRDRSDDAPKVASL